MNEVRVFWRIDYYVSGMQPQHNIGLLLLALRETDTQGPLLHRNNVPSIISIDENHPVVKTYHLPLTERTIVQVTCREHSRSELNL